MTCTATTKAGTPCKGHAVNGGELCAGHAGLGFGADPLRAASRSHAVRKAAATERKLSLLERMGRELERRAVEIVDAYMAAGVDRGDWRALDALVTRVHGRPVERVEVQAPVDPLGVAAMSQAERSAMLAQVLEMHPSLAALVPADHARMVEQ